MSDVPPERQHPRQAQTDRGMTLPELLISVTVIGLIVGVLATSIIVTLRQHDNTEGRLNVARFEQNVSMWMPADLASAETVDTSPEATPCGAPICDGIFLGDGSNVLMLEWTEVGEGEAVCPPDGIDNCTVTRVSYNFFPTTDGTGYELRRIECVSTDLSSWACDALVMLRELPGPPAGGVFVPGVGEGAAGCASRIGDPAQPDCTEPTWVIIVSEPLDPCAGLSGDEFTACVGAGEPGATVKDANRVIVSIDGGGGGSGGGGGVNQISITAGGTVRQTISADSMTGAPSFMEARSRCGGPLTLIIDQSTSIPSTARPKVVSAALQFVQLLRGTPVQIQVVRFSDTARVLGDGLSTEPETGWHEYFDMTEEGDWNILESQINGLSSTFSGSTNWEDALFRTFYNSDGTTAQVVPETVVFFTDGVPTVDRLDGRGNNESGQPAFLPPQPAPYQDSTWQSFNGSAAQAADDEAAKNPSLWVSGQRAGVYFQPSFDRANHIASNVRAEQAGYVRMIGVGVGGINDTVRYLKDPLTGYRNYWERGYGRYQKGTAVYQSRRDFEQATTFQADLNYQQATGSYQSTVNYQEATSNFQANLDYEQATTFQTNLRFQRYSSGSWGNTDAATYYANNTTSNDSDGWRINGTVSTWATISEALYDAHRASAPSNFRINGWTDRTPAQYYTNQPSAPTKWQAITTRSNYTISAADFNAYRLQSPANFFATWSNRTPTQYFTNQPGSPGLWRINGTRSAYTVTAAEFTAYASTAPSNYTATWTNRGPAEYYTNEPTAPAMWRINGTRTAYSITEAVYDAWRSEAPSNFIPGGWTDRTPTQYYEGQPTAPTRWRNIAQRTSWYNVTEAEYTAYHGSDTTTNWRTQISWTWIPQAEYEAGEAVDPAMYNDTGTKTWLPVSSNPPEWERVSESGTAANGYRQQSETVTTPPYSGFNPAVSEAYKGHEILAKLVSGDRNGLPWVEVYDADGSDNAEIANMFVLGNDAAAWDKLTPVMKAIALGECGGTLTLSTRTAAGAKVGTPFTYENSAVYRSDGSIVSPFEPNVVTTNAENRTRGFDYAVPGGTYITTEIRPQASSAMLGYEPIAWECRAGARPLSAAEINEQPIELVITRPDGTTQTVPSGWSKISVRIAANEAVSCVLKVAKVS